MTTIPGDDRVTLAALKHARELVKAGVPLFVCGLTPEGEPMFPKAWQRTEPDPAVIDAWRPGKGLCAVTGVRNDVLDIDPRNGGDKSFAELDEQLGDDGPEVLASYATPSGGRHLWIGMTGLGSHNGILPGIDLKGGKPDGSGRGMVFIPPTKRPAHNGPNGRGKTSWIPYRYNRAPQLRVKDLHTDAILKLFANQLASQNGYPGKGRPDLDELEERCLSAETGDQRAALRALVGEMQKQGMRKARIRREVMDIVTKMPSYNDDDPWSDNPRTRRYINGLFYAPGRIIADATDEETRILLSLQGPGIAGLVRSMSELEDNIVRWLWPGYIAFRELTLMDGEKGQGKSFVTDWMTSCATNGWPFPGMAEAVCEPIRVIIFTDEGHANSITKPRLRACGANLDIVYIPAVRVPKRGEKPGDWDLGLPDGAGMIGKMIASAGAQLAIFDPITDFLGEDVNSHNDASVRRALRPLAVKLGELGCAGFAIRHMNKDTKADVRYRGSGSTAFQNRARVHLVTTRVPESYVATGQAGEYAIGMVDSNLAVRENRSLVYSIVDSDIPMDELGNMVGKCRWEGYADIDLTKSEKPRRGPAPSAERDRATALLIELFKDQQTWPQRDLTAKLADAGINLTEHTLRKATRELGIRREPVYQQGKRGVQGWRWTTEKATVGG